MNNKKELPKPVDKTIDGEKYTFYFLSPRISYPLLLKIARMVAPSIGAAIDSIKESGNDNLKEASPMTEENDNNLEKLLDSEISLEKIIKLLCQHIEIDAVQNIIDTLFEQTFHHGHGIVLSAYDALFTGRPLHLTKVLAAAIGVQFGDFLAGKSVTENLKSVADLAQG